MPLPPETPLTGGRVTAGVVRIGKTVRRPLGPHSPFVHRLLLHLAAAGFTGAPRLLEADDGEARESLSYIDGTVPSELQHWTDHQLQAAAGLIRALHDASAGSPLASDTETVCHNDLSPCNFVFRDETPVAVIDFDAAAPGRRLWDLGYAAWLWLDLGCPDYTAQEQRRRLTLFADSYGACHMPDLIHAIAGRQAMLRDEAEAAGRAEMAAWAAQCFDWTQAALR